LDGNEGPAAAQAIAIADKLSKSVETPVYLQDERLTSFAAEANLSDQGLNAREITKRIDSEAAAIILSDFLSPIRQQRRCITRQQD